jgi:ArsR family transcriptional regulator
MSFSKVPGKKRLHLYPVLMYFIVKLRYTINMITKAHEFTEKQIETAKVAKALGHPARIAILQLLAERETCICGDIAGELPLAQSTVSQHLKALKKAGIIKGEIEGVSTCYCIDEENTGTIKNLLTTLIENIQPKNCY